MGYPAVDTIMTPADADALRAERNATIAAENAAKDALNGAAAKQEQERCRGHGPRPARGLLGGRRRTLALDRRHDDAGHGHRARSYTGPQLVASWYDANGTQIGSGNLSALLDPDVTPRAYLYHVTKYRLGDASTIGTPMPAFIRIAAPNGDVAELAVKKWVGNGAPQYAAGFQQDFNTHYVDPQEGYSGSRISPR